MPDEETQILDVAEATKPAEDAPRGRRADGAPRRKPGPRKGAPQRGGRRPSSSKPGPPDYRPGILGLGQLVAVPLSFVAPIDSATVSMHLPTIAEAANELAHNQPAVAAALERALSVGPWGAFLAACMPLGVQLAHNHGMIPEAAAVALGATPRRVLAEQLGVAEQPERQAEQPERQAEPEHAGAGNGYVGAESVPAF